MGVDEVVGEIPINRFEIKGPEAGEANLKPQISLNKQEEQTIMKPKAVGQVTAQPVNIGNPASTEQVTRKMANECSDIVALRAAVHDFQELSIAKTATNTVFGDGNPNSEIMLIGEAPGAEEDAKGIPFCGASGQLLDQMLACVGLFRDKNFYITNTVFWRPPGNRRPTPEELAICRPFVEKHIGLIKPKLILLVGGTAVTSLLNDSQGISRLRGNYYEYNNKYLNEPVKTTAIFHPSFLLRSPGQKRVAWADLLKLREYIVESNVKM